MYRYDQRPKRVKEIIQTNADLGFSDVGRRSYLLSIIFEFDSEFLSMKKLNHSDLPQGGGGSKGTPIWSETAFSAI